MKTGARLAFVLTLAGGLLGVAVPAIAEHGSADNASPNMLHVAGRPYSDTNSDLAFWGNYAAAGGYNGFRIYDISKPRKPVLLSDFRCRNPQGDVSFYQAKERLLLFVSVDTPQLPANGTCPSQDVQGEAVGWEGIRIFDVTNPKAPFFLTAVRTDCGSHTHTTIPDDANQRALIYVSSYPLATAAVGPNCGAPNTDPRTCFKPHAKISIVGVPDGAPQFASVINEPGLHCDTLEAVGQEESLPGAVGCHDITAFTDPKVMIAAAACLSEGQLWDISDPANPKTLDPLGHTHIRNEAIEIWHSAAFTWDATVVLFGDEHGGGLASGCTGSADTTGNIWFYKTVAPGSPEAPLLGRYALPRPQHPEACTLHNFNVIPVNDNEAYIGVSSAYEGGTSVFDFTGLKNAPAPPLDSPFAAPTVGTEIAFFDASGGDGPRHADTWSSYWYNDFIYANDGLGSLRPTNPGGRGLDVFMLLAPNRKQFTARSFHHSNPQTQEDFETLGG
jgi:LVIVD repeat